MITGNGMGVSFRFLQCDHTQCPNPDHGEYGMVLTNSESPYITVVTLEHHEVAQLAKEAYEMHQKFRWHERRRKMGLHWLKQMMNRIEDEVLHDLRNLEGEEE